MSNDTRQRLNRWLTPEVIVAVVTLGLGGVAIYARVTSDIRDLSTKMGQQDESRKDESRRSEDSRRLLDLRVTSLEQGRATDRETMIEIKTIVKRIDEKTGKE